MIVADAFENVAEAAQRFGATVCLRRFGFSHLGPALTRAAKERERRLEHAKETTFNQGQQAILEHVAAGKKLAEVLEEIVLLIEKQGENSMLCSILRSTARPGDYVTAPPSPAARSSKAWREQERLARRGLLRGCRVSRRAGSSRSDASQLEHSLTSRSAVGTSVMLVEPDLDGTGRGAGTFAMYYREARAPRTPSESGSRGRRISPPLRSHEIKPSVRSCRSTLAIVRSSRPPTRAFG